MSRRGGQVVVGVLAACLALAGAGGAPSAYVQRQGPGTTCWHTASGAGCNQHLDPLPWLIVGSLFVVAGLVIQICHSVGPHAGRVRRKR